MHRSVMVHLNGTSGDGSAMMFCEWFIKHKSLPLILILNLCLPLTLILTLTLTLTPAPTLSLSLTQILRPATKPNPEPNL